MAVEPRRDAIAAPNFFAFVVAYAGWATGLVMWALRPLITGSDTSMTKSIAFFALVPVLLLASSRWVGSSPDLATLLRRSISAHVLSGLLAGALVGIARSSDPGASAHGGIFLFFIILIPYGTFAGSVVGLVGGLASFGVMRLFRAR